MRVGVRLLAAFAILASSSAAVSAHHSFAAQYDANKPVTLKGIVSKVEWTNPHARFYVDVRDETGTVTNWIIPSGCDSRLVWVWPPGSPICMM